MNLYVSIISYSLAWALVYSLFQGLFIYTILFMLLKAFPGLSARLKYIASYSALGGMFVWFTYTWASRSVAMGAQTMTEPAPGSGVLTNTSLQFTLTNTLSGDNGLTQVLRSIEQFFPWFLIAYVIGLAFMTTRFLLNISETGKLRREGAKMQAEFESITSYWQDRLGIKKNVCVFLTDRVNVPVMLGALKPVILLPFATASYLTTEQVEAIILHELAHVKRHDYVFNILQTIIETVLFFNPFVWATSSIIRREREHCCDDMVVACSGNPLPYAKALTILESQRMEAANLTLAATGNKNQLLNRIKRIMEMKKNNTHYSKPAIIISALIAIAFIIAALTPTFAQKVKVGKSDTSKGKPVYKQKIVTVDGNGKKTEKTKVSDKPIPEMEDDANANNVDVHVSFTDDEDGKVNKHVYKKKIKIDDGDLSKLSEELAKASADIKVALAEVSDELSAVDWAKIRREIKEALAEVDRNLGDTAMHRKIKIELHKELDEAKEELKRASKEIRKSKRVIADARAGGSDEEGKPIKIHANSDEIEAMLEKMEHDGLIDRNTIFRVEKSGNELYINGKRQPRGIYEKYNGYIPHKSAVIKGDKGMLNVNIND